MQRQRDGPRTFLPHLQTLFGRHALDLTSRSIVQLANELDRSRCNDALVFTRSTKYLRACAMPTHRFHDPLLPQRLVPAIVIASQAASLVAQEVSRVLAGTADGELDTTARNGSKAPAA